MLYRYIHRFRHAPATQRSERGKPRDTFWWKQASTTDDHITPPKQPWGHSTPTSDSKKVGVLEGMGVGIMGLGYWSVREFISCPSSQSVSVTPRVSSDGDESLEERTEVLIDKRFVCYAVVYTVPLLELVL